MKYDPDCYRRRKLGIVQRSNDFVAFKEIRDKWGLNDIQIRTLLQDFTRTEILSASEVNGKLIPKDLINLKGLLVVIAIIASFLLHSNSMAQPESKLAVIDSITQP